MQSPQLVGRVTLLCRYPVKSMQGEEQQSADVTPRGLAGDRSHALLDADGHVVSAKDVRKFPGIFAFHARFTEEPKPGHSVPPVRITLPGGDTVLSNDRDVGRRLSTALGREVRLERTPPEKPTIHMLHPDLSGPSEGDRFTRESILEHSFFDLAVLHLLTTATLEQLQEHHPSGKFAVQRFRPNVVITPADGGKGFIENDWVGRTLRLGDTVRVRISGPCSRCVMTTLAQGDLPRDLDILRTIARHNAGNVGVYAAVEQPGRVRQGDECWLE